MEHSTPASVAATRHASRAAGWARTWAPRAVILLILAATFAWYFHGDLKVDFARVWATCFNP